VTGDEVRKAFLQFFEGKGHTVIPSSSLVPENDPTLLLTSAGMVQIKPYFLGLAAPPNPRLASCQKCFRTSDIDSVGDNTHLTFFEMLGNFSVGDYFKKEAIAWAWEFVTEWVKLPPERLWITVFLDDDEAAAIWQRTGVPVERIVRLGEDDNFWGPAGESGPCGPCSEILYDFGEEQGCGRPECGPACDCGRFSEVWNLVFTQYDQDEQGKRTPLPKPNIDTGMGLERMAAILQGQPSVYGADLFRPLVAAVVDITGKKYGEDRVTDRAIRIVAEHGRAVTFLIADGVVPSNEGRGYVLRRVLRRASLFGRKLGLEGAFLAGLADVAVDKMGHVYPELSINHELIREVIDLEEERFGQALSTGLNWLDRLMERVGVEKEKRIGGEDVFMLYDTYGFPKELTAEIAAERGFLVDLEGFEGEMERQRERARAAHRFNLGEKAATESYEQLGISHTRFVGYEQWKCQSVVVALMVGGEPAEHASEGDDVDVVLKETPFYGEMGGQVGDTGEIRGDRGKVLVSQTFRPLPDLVVHQGKVVDGRLALNDRVEAEVDLQRRLDIARNHTATHLLQAALRLVLGQHVRQSGSLVAPDRFRFDFTHLTAPGKDELVEIQHIVNDKIRHNLPVVGSIRSYEEAVSRGAIALFGEKYGDTVRMVEIGDPPFSKELCGGTHVSSTGEIGLIYITAEGSVGSGMRRIEAVTGRGAERLLEQRLSALDIMAQELETSPDAVHSKLSATLTELEKERKRALAMEKELAKSTAGSLLQSKVEEVEGIKLVRARVPNASPEALRQMGDQLRESLGSGVIVLGTIHGGKPTFVAMVSGDLVVKGFHAGEIVKQVAKVAGGGGGGKAGLGQGSGRDKAKMDEALDQAEHIIRAHYDKESGTWKGSV
jgi:alanyl-tRNA synthetase